MTQSRRRFPTSRTGRRRMTPVVVVVLVMLLLTLPACGGGGSGGGDDSSGSDDDVSSQPEVNGLVDPSTSSTAVDEFGNKISLGLFLVRFSEDSNTTTERSDIISSFDGRIVGVTTSERFYQVKIESTDLDETFAIAEDLNAHSRIDVAVPDIKFSQDSTMKSWPSDATVFDGLQLKLNAVQKSQASGDMRTTREIYSDALSSASDTAASDPVTIGVSEVSDEVDSTLLELTRLPDGVQLFANTGVDADAPGDNMHASLVAGVILGSHHEDSQMAGLLSYLGGTGSGFDVRVEESKWFSRQIDTVNKLVRNGADIVNMSHGGYSSSASNIFGESCKVIDGCNAINRSTFGKIQEAYKRLFLVSPDVSVGW